MLEMKKSVFEIQHIPAALYGEPSDRVYLFIHGKCGCKEEAAEFAGIVCPRGWQVLGIDLPEHGSRKAETGTFDPWHVIPELQAVLAYAGERWKRIALRANSIGAWFSMQAFQGQELEQCLFVSPVVDMEQLIRRMMQWAGVTEAELEVRGRIETDFGETLSWQYFQYAKEHPVETLPIRTAVLYAGQDNLTPRQEITAFSERFDCDLTVMEDGEHWFHTPEQLEVLRRWEAEHTAPELQAEEILFFAGKPEELDLYTAFRNRLLAEVGDVRIKVSRTQITFSGKYGFAFVSHPRRKKDTGILVSFGLSHRQESDRIWQASEPYPGRWTHHVMLGCRAEADEELMGWIREAWWFANTK
ncbi:DUF5655 domain-containing protein [Dysosmobacter sp.]|uniref:DUF5655 domain-containing protein n=1 Tax=Dysosmobacter sp. TaxID=2591382 RepID=UPI002A8E2311|nr:DUF5655 domain-containing protein [Dysosmobacter sp.]MDY3282402.1 DUF5655 domain-containing protein [Dysosmobacter sp.]